jgi:Tfp pilus assembly protein PilO
VSRATSPVSTLLKDRRVIIACGSALVLALVWLIGFFLPQGKDLSKYQAQQEQLGSQQSSLEAQLTQLRATSKAVPQLLSLQSQLDGLIPPTADIYNYITLMSNTASATGVRLVSITPTTTGAEVTGTDLQAIPISLSTSGSYDDTLGFVKALYALPRLTVINSIAITGGGPGTNRSSSLNESYSLTIYTSAPVMTAATG